VVSIPGIESTAAPPSLGSSNPLLSPTGTIPFPSNSNKLQISASDIEIDTSNPIGEGAFGTVYTGRLRGQVRVAVKTLKGVDPKAMAIFAREVENWSGVVQRNVMGLMAYCLDPPMTVCEIADGGNMRQLLASRAWDQVLGRKFLFEVASGMTYLHSLNILHGDLKAVNVLIDGNRALITDFGLSQFRADMTRANTTTHAGFSGTPGFMAPELFEGRSLRAPADVYAFGMVCFEVVSRGKYPFKELPKLISVSLSLKDGLFVTS